MKRINYKILWVNLTDKKLHEEVITDNILRQYLGGYGLGARILFNHIKPQCDPLGPWNILGFVPGVLTGTPAVGGYRYTVVGKSPLTGGWGDANSGGDFGPKLRKTGYDAIFVEGVAEEPVYILIEDQKVQILSAKELWGKTTYETEDLLRKQYGEEIGIACIGPAGEKQSRIAAIINNEGRAAARSGLGAVMGSKRLKAVVVKGTKEVFVHDRQKAREVEKRCAKGLTGHVVMLREFGTPAIFVRCVQVGDAPIKNWAGVPEDFPHPEKIGAEAVKVRQKKRFSCYRCPIGCGGRMKAPIGPYSYSSKVHKPEYETLAMFGSNCLNADLESIIMINDICNSYGLDTISTGACVAMAIECFENGILNEKDTEGLELKWGNSQAIVEFVWKIAKREGIGDLFADGVRIAAEKLGQGAEKFAMHVGGQEIPAHDPKYGFNWALAYRMDATPARHTQGPGMPVAGIPMPELNRTSQTGMQPAYKLGMCLTHVINSLGMCLFVFWAYPHGDFLLDTINAITGWDVSYEELFVTGERIANIRHIFNLREGLSPFSFKFPDRIAGRPPKDRGPLKGVTINEMIMDKEFFEVMEWDFETAKPSRKKLLELGLEDIANFIL